MTKYWGCALVLWGGEGEREGGMHRIGAGELNYTIIFIFAFHPDRE